MQIVSVASAFRFLVAMGHRDIRLKRKVLGYRGRTLVWQERRTFAGAFRNIRDSQVW
jgi:hypothetical protein